MLCGKRSGKLRDSQPRLIQSDSEVDMRGFGGDGMRTEDEREDLARNPLPEIVPKEDHVREIPTSVYNVENRMREIADEMKKLSKLRDTLIDRAIATGIINDGKCVIIKRESNLPRVVNPDVFAKKFPTE